MTNKSPHFEYAPFRKYHTARVKRLRGSGIIDRFKLLYENNGEFRINTDFIVGIGASFIAAIGIVTVLIMCSSPAHAQDPIRLSVEVIPADTCALMYDTSGFKGKNLREYVDHLERLISLNNDEFLFLTPGDLLAIYPVKFKGRKACLDDLLNQAVSGTDLIWECKSSNILIWRK